MKGDFSRGFQPDSKRGERYRRVLLQQGRLLLDSDVAALVDALDGSIRLTAKALGCAAGSPDLGFLITPGRLLALFDELDHVEAGSAVDIRRDYARRYLSRYPSLRMEAGSGSAAQRTVTINFREQIDADPVALWLVTDATSSFTITVEIGGSSNPVTVSPSPGFTRVQVSGTATAGHMRIVIPASAPTIWIGLVESHEPALARPRFWAASGQFMLDGVIVEQPEDRRWNRLVGDPSRDGSSFDVLSPSTGEYLCAYLELWERHYTAVHDPGMQERALGSELDTTTRTRWLAQVKLLPLSSTSSSTAIAEARMAFSAIDHGNAELEITTPPAVGTVSPCDLPEIEGYQGLDNRLYRFEVHTGGDLSQLQLKYSRNNGAELVAVTATGDPIITHITIPNHARFEDQDLIELRGEAIEHGDSSPAEVIAGSFTPATRRVGALVTLSDPQPGTDGTIFAITPTVALADLSDATDFPITARRWDGLLESLTSEVTLPDGSNLELVVTGDDFRPGQWWEYEARVHTDNVSSEWPSAPHGPERLFAPLAVLRYDGSSDPVELIAWLDERFARACELSADDIAFDGGLCGSSAMTVQEQLEELCKRDGAGCCCEVTLTPGSDDAAEDDAARINQVITDNHGDVVICLTEGIYRLLSPIRSSGDKVVIRGCPEAALVAYTDARAIVVEDGTLELEDLVVASIASVGAGVGGTQLIHVSPEAHALRCRRVGLVGPGDADASRIAIQVGTVSAVAPDLADWASDDTRINPGSLSSGPSVSLDACVVAARWAVVGTRIDNLVITDSALHGVDGLIYARHLVSPSIRDSVLTTGLTHAQLSGEETEPGNLLNDGESLQELLAGITGGDGVGLAAGELTSGSLARNRITAALGVYVETLSDSTCSNNHYDGAYGLFVRTATRVVIDAELMSSSETGVTIVEAATQLDLVNCVIESEGDGVVLGVDVDDATVEMGSFSLVRVAGNQIVVEKRAGVRLGRSDKVAATAVNEDLVLAISDNEIAGQTGILATAPNNTATRALRITDNLLRDVTVGVDLSGPGRHVVAENHVVAQSSSGSIAIRVNLPGSSDNVRVADNTIGGTAAKSTSSGVGISLLGLGDAFVSGNFVTHASIALQAANHGELDGSGNDFGPGRVDIAGPTRVSLSGNRTESTVNINGPNVAIVNDNRVGGLYTDGLLIWLADNGRAQVQGNQVAGLLRVLPMTIATPIYNGGGSWGIGGLFNPYFMLLSEAEDTGTMTLGYSMTIEDNVELKMRDDSREKILMDSARELMNEAATGSNFNGTREQLDLELNLPELELNVPEANFYWFLLSEGTFEVQVNDNWSKTLQVGNAPYTFTHYYFIRIPPYVMPMVMAIVDYQHYDVSESSVVQVNGNRIDEALIVNEYLQRMVTTNQMKVKRTGVSYFPYSTERLVNNNTYSEGEL